MQAPASKALLRAEILARRGTIGEPAAASFARRIAELGCALAAEKAARVAAAYWPIQNEVSPLPLLDTLAAGGYMTALPVMIRPDKKLIFRAWQPGAPLSDAKFGIKEPPVEAALVQPDLIFVPLLGFDRRGNRLGYGAGFYDRTFAELPTGQSLVTVGLAYAMQEVPEVPTEPHDHRLDFVLTECEWITCR